MGLFDFKKKKEVNSVKDAFAQTEDRIPARGFHQEYKIESAQEGNRIRS